MRILITGYCGFVGRAFTRYFLGSADIIGIDTALGPGSDVRDVFRSERYNDHFDLVIHCAAVVGGRARIDGHPLDLADNLAIDAALFQWAARTKPGKVVYFSSSAAYPTKLQQRGSQWRLSEEDINLHRVENPDSVYGWAKLTGEILAEHARAAGVDVLVVRPFSGYGSDQTLDYPFPSFIDRAMSGADVFPIWGDGSQVRDWIHIDDVVTATMHAVDADLTGPLNLGTGRPVSFDELARLCCAATGSRPRFEHLVGKPTGVHYRVCDPARLHELYQPRVTIEEGIARAVESRAKVAA